MTGRGRLALVAAALLAATLASANSQADGEGWRAAAFDGQVSAFVSSQIGGGIFASAVYLGLSCGARPVLRFRGPVEGTSPDATTRSVSLAFEVGDDLFVMAAKASLAPIPAARPPDNWSSGVDPNRVELVAERAVEEPHDGDAIRELARFLREAEGPRLIVRGADPFFTHDLPMEGARHALGRFLETCGGLAE